MALNRIEMETIINWNLEEDTANIFTYERRVQKHMEKVLGIKPTDENGFGGKSYDIPKKWCKLPRKTRTRIMSDEQRQVARDRLMKARKNKKSNMGGK